MIVLTDSAVDAPRLGLAQLKHRSQYLAQRRGMLSRISYRSQTRRMVFCTAANEAPKHVVITGASKGLGFALAKSFVARGHSVVICARNSANLREAAAILADLALDREQVHALPCDVSKPEEVDALAAFCKETLGRVDIFVNNAGRASGSKQPLWELPAEDVLETAAVNTAGSLLCSRAALRLFVEQLAAAPPPEQASPGTAPACPRFHLYNFGYSVSGSRLSSSTVPHKATKRGVAEMTGFLAAEVRAAGLQGSVGVHELSPGLVLTDLLLKEDTPVPLRRFFNALAEEADTVAEFCVPRMVSMDKSNSEVRFLSLPDAVRRILTGLPQILWGGRFFDRDGNRVGNGADFNRAGVRKIASELAELDVAQDERN